MIGAHVLAYEAGTLEDASPRMVGMRAVHSNQSCRTGVALEAHFGLGKRHAVDLEVKLLDGRAVRFPNLGADRVVDLNLETGSVSAVAVPGAGRTHRQ